MRYADTINTPYSSVRANEANDEAVRKLVRTNSRSALQRPDSRSRDSGDPRLFCNTLPFLTRLNYAPTDSLVRTCSWLA